MDNELITELKSRNITIDDLRLFEAYGVAAVYKQEWTIDEIAKDILNGRLEYLTTSDEEFVEAQAREVG